MSRRRSLVRPLLFSGRRTRQRPLQLVLLVVPLVVAGGLIGASSLVGALALEDGVHTKLAAEPPAARSVAVEYRAQPRARNTALERSAQRTLTLFRSVSLAPVRVQVWDPIAPADQRGVRLVVTDTPATVEVDSGRLAHGCRGQTCEGLAISGALELGRMLTIGMSNRKPVRLKIVGVGSLRARALPDRELLVGNAVLVPRVAGPLADVELSSGSTVSQSTVLRPQAVHAADLSSLADRMRVAAVRLERADPSVTVSAPTALLQRLAHLGAVAKNRLLIVASEGAALMLAFAAFVAASRRRAVDQLRLQLETLGASRRQITLARAAEVALPTLLALVVVLAGLRIALVPITRSRGLPSGFVAQALPLTTLLSIVGLELIGMVILFAAAVPAVRTRLGIGPLEVAALTALGVIVWQAAATGGLDPNQIAGGAGGLPVLLLTPALAVLVAGIVLLRLLPVLFRLAERLARRAPTPVRLALVAAARSPGQAAATTTFLAVALGSALFSLNYRATLEHQASAAAAFEVGGAARVMATGPTGTADASATLRRYAAGTPALRLSATVDQGRGEQRPVTLLALPADRIASVSGWQDRFSPLSRDEIATRLRPRPKAATSSIPGLPIASPRKRTTLTGPALPAGTSALRLWVRDNSSAQRSVVLHLLLPGQGFATLALGQVRESWRLLETEVPHSLAGARLVGIEFPVGSNVATSVIVVPGGIVGNVTEGKEAVDFGGLAARTRSGWRPLPSFADWTGARAPDFEGILTDQDFKRAPIAHGFHFLLSGTSVPLVRPPVELETAGINSSTFLLPALAGPVPASLAVDRQLTVSVLGQELRLRTIGRASLVPTITSDPRAFLVVDYGTLFAALNADQPGLAPPSEAWFFGQRPPALPAATRVLRLDQERARLLEDPLASGTRQLLAWSGYVAAALALLGLALSIRLALAAERQVLAEYEALGVAPRTLGLGMQLRLVFLSLLGLVGGLAGAALAVRLVAALVAVTGAAGQPLPPITTTIAWQRGGILLAVVAAGAIFAATMLVRRSLREATGRRLRL